MKKKINQTDIKKFQTELAVYCNYKSKLIYTKYSHNTVVTLNYHKFKRSNKYEILVNNKNSVYLLFVYFLKIYTENRYYAIYDHITNIIYE